jgi:branched-chain amino acid transport system substrate-binding protein
MIRKLSACLGAVTLAAALTAAQAQDTITFGAALSLTGKMSTEGRLVRDGYDFYVHRINERGGIKVGDKTYRVAIRYYDDQSDANISARLYERLINQDGIRLLLGPYSSGITVSASAVAEKHQVPMVAAHAAATAVFERGFQYLFATLTPVDQYTANIVKMAAEASPPVGRIALIHENALFPKASIDAADDQARKAGLHVVYKQAYPAGTRDFSAMLSALKRTRPDAIIASGYTGDMIVIARQAAEQGVRVNMMAFTLGPTLPGFVESLGTRSEYLLEPVQWSRNMPWKDSFFDWTPAQFSDLFAKEFGYVPDYHPPQSMAALQVYQNALERAGTLDPRKVRDAIATTDIMTVYGPVRFNERGQNVAKGMAVIQIQGGKPVVVYPPEVAAAEFIYPIPGL